MAAHKKKISIASGVLGAPAGPSQRRLLKKRSKKVAKKKVVKKKQTIIGKVQTFQANRGIAASRGLGRQSRNSGLGKQSNSARLALARKSAKGLQKNIIKKNKAKTK